MYADPKEVKNALKHKNKTNMPKKNTSLAKEGRLGSKSACAPRRMLPSLAWVLASQTPKSKVVEKLREEEPVNQNPNTRDTSQMGQQVINMEEGESSDDDIQIEDLGEVGDGDDEPWRSKSVSENSNPRDDSQLGHYQHW